MTEEDQSLLNELSSGVQQLFQAYEELQAEKRTLEGHVSVLTQEIARLEQEKAVLGRKLEKVRVANAVLGGNDTDGLAKRRIDRLIREIDKCIALLNR